MRKKCCAPGCKSYYDNKKEYVNVFKFPPGSERKELWVHKLYHDDFSPSTCSVLCIKHSDDWFITCEDTVR